jgi:hypothetical protein
MKSPSVILCFRVLLRKAEVINYWVIHQHERNALFDK